MKSLQQPFGNRAEQPRAGQGFGISFWGVLALFFLFSPLMASSQLTSSPDPNTEKARLTYDREAGVFRILGLEKAVFRAFCALKSAKMAEKFQVFPRFKAESDLAAYPMMGRYLCENGEIQFHPAFELQDGVAYEALFHFKARPEDSEIRLQKRIRLERKRGVSKVSVVDIFPSGKEIPANLLKLYVSFSGSMSRDYARHHVKLLDGSGKVIQGAFLDLEQELWNSERNRLTLWLDPGRIKRGLAPNETHGPPLSPGLKITVVVEPSWPDGLGQPMRNGFRKSYRVCEPDRESPDTSLWHWDLPVVGSLETLNLRFPESLDYALLQSALWVADVGGRPLQGQIQLDEGEKVWRFKPLTAWRDTSYVLQISEQLEDLAGNNLNGLFDRELNSANDGVRSRGTSRHLPFRPKNVANQ